MKQIILSLGVALLLGHVAEAKTKLPFHQKSNRTVVKIQKNGMDKIPTHFIPTPNMDEIRSEDQRNDRKGLLYRIGVHSYTHLTTENSGTWNVLSNGNKHWQLKIQSPGAEALSFLFDHFRLSKGATFWVENLAGEKVSKVITSADMLEDFQQNIPLCFGDELILNLVDLPGMKSSEFTLNRVVYNYRSTGAPKPKNMNKDFADAGDCNVNINCPEGNDYQDEKRGVARIYLIVNDGAGWCSGSLVNNTSNDCKPLFLTALHCGPSAEVSPANMKLWVFYFGYEAASCSNPTAEGSLARNYMTGCFRLADSNDYTTDITRNDYLLVQLGTPTTVEATVTKLKSSSINAYWNGWDAKGISTSSGVSIHHPRGDIKKISTFKTTTISTSYYGQTPNGTHWQANWASTETDWAITEGGSSGSPLFAANGGKGRIIGTLSGGPSSCGSSSKYDYYGKVSQHWTSNGTTAALSLKYHLDPTSTGLLVLDGSANPCSAPATFAANFRADNTVPCAQTPVNFTNLSTGNPTAFAWTITPNTVTYTGGTSATSEHPRVIFNNSGVYTVKLVATTAAGSDEEVKADYINVNSAGIFPLTENFDGTTFPPTGWTIENPDAPSTAWASSGNKGFERRSAFGNTGSTAGCAGINLIKYTNMNRLDGIITPTVNLNAVTAPKLTFRKAYRNFSGTSIAQSYQDELRIYVSTDCGVTWGSSIYFKKGGQLASNGSTGSAFTPMTTGDWATETVDLSAYSGQSIRVKFEITNRNGNNFYIDDVNITNTISAPKMAHSSMNPFTSDVAIYPNPSTGKFTVKYASNELVNGKIVLQNTAGQIIFEENLVEFNGTFTKDFDVLENGKGIYFISIFDQNIKTVQKVVIY